MRGNPILQIGVLLTAICLTGLLVAAVLDNARQTDPVPPVTSEELPPSPVVPTLLTLTLSAPAKSITFTEVCISIKLEFLQAFMMVSCRSERCITP